MTEVRSSATFWRRGFRSIGAVDGITFLFSTPPSWETQTWNTRKGNYAMGGTGVCDHLGRFTYFSTSYFGSFNDFYAHKRTQLFSPIQTIFSRATNTFWRKLHTLFLPPSCLAFGRLPKAPTRRDSTRTTIKRELRSNMPLEC